MPELRPQRVASWAIRQPRLAIAVLASVVVAAAPGLLRLQVRTDGHALVPPDDPVVAKDAEIREHFGLRDPIVVLIETSHPDGIYNLDTLTSVQKISDALRALDGVEPADVTSLATENRDRVRTGTLNFRPYLEPLPDTPGLMDTLRGDVDAAEILHGTMLSPGAEAVSILVRVPAGDATSQRADFYRRVRELVASFESDRDRILVVGAPVAEALLGTHILEDLRLLLPLALAVIAAVIWLGCRRFWGVALALGEVGACLVFTFGCMGWLGFPVYLTTAILPVILTTIGLADEIHIFWHYQRLLALEDATGTPATGTSALERAMAEMGRPVVLSSLTTSLAFLSFLASPIAAVSSFGLFAAAGTLFCMVWSLTVIPAGLALLLPEGMRRPRPPRAAAMPGSRLRDLVAPLLGHPAPTLAALLLASVGLGLGARQLVVQDSWLDGFARSSDFYRDSARANELLHGTHTLLAHLAFDPPPERLPQGVELAGPLLSPELLRSLGELEEMVRARPEVGGVLGTYSHLTTVAYLWQGRREGSRTIPDQPATVERILDRFDMGRGAHRRREVIDDDLRRTVVTIFLGDANYRDTAALMSALSAWVDEHLADYGARLDFAGDVAVSQAMIPAIVRTQVSSLLLALAAALVVLCLLYRSLVLGALVVLPTCFAVLWIFGLMGWAGIPLGVATSMFCAITLGIGVDYGIHFIERFRHGRGEVPRAVEEAGPAIVADTLAISLGFGLLAVSQVPANARLGLLVAGALMATSILTLTGLASLLTTPVRRYLPRQSGAAAALVLLVLVAAGCRPGRDGPGHGGPGHGGPAEELAGAPDFATAVNVGKAHLENRKSAAAIEAFARAVELRPRAPSALRNLARAHLLAEDVEAALAALGKAAALEQESAATSYLTGIAYARESRFEEALPHLEEAVRLDPDQAALRFQLGNAYQALERHDRAVEQLEAALRLDPLHTSALFKLASHARVAGDRQEFEVRQRELMRLRALLGDTSRKPEILERCVYTLAELPPAGEAETEPALEVTFNETPVPVAGDTAAVLDVDPRGRVTTFLAGSEGGRSLLSWDDGWQGGALDLGSVGGGGTVLGAEITAAAGNFHDLVPEKVPYDPETHPHPDVLLLSPAGAQLLRGGAGGFTDVTEAAGLASLRGRRARWADVDHDGDLDLVVARREGLELWQNHGNGTFREVAAEIGLTGTGPAVDVAAVDLDGDVAIDLVVARGDGPTRVFDNQRTGSFAPRPDPPGPWPAARRVLVDDLDNDGRPDAALIGERQAVLLYGGRPERRRLELGELDPIAAALFDYDNDGRLDLCVAGTGGLRLWRNEAAGWREVTVPAGLAGLRLEGVRELLAADFDADADSDLLVVTAGGLRFLRNDGGHVNGQLKIRLQGTKTNPGGFGTEVEVRRETFRVARAVSGLPIEIGLGGHRRLDSVRTLWTNGVVDNEIDVEIGPQRVLTVLEKNVAAGSCPFLYAWDGEDFRFVTDLLGNSPVGLSLRRGVPLAADPDELVEIGGPERLALRRGRFVVQVTEEMREVLYLDHARLIAVDHPPAVEVHPTDKLMPPPFPASELWPLAAPRVPRSAVGDDGVDRTSEVSALDGVFAPPGVPLPPPWRGVTWPLATVLDFGELPPDVPWVLALTGWLQYGDASTNIALSQNPDAVVLPPVLEAETAGGWRPIDVTVGVPAGKTKTLLVDLAGKLPPGARRLRLRTSLEIRWDRIALGERPAPTVVVRHELLPVAAELAWRGFSEIRARAPGHPTTPDFAAVSPRPPWRTALAGWSTRYGEVLELVSARDQRLVILNAGDAVELAFDASALPPPAAGHRRTFFFYSVGWDKDGDHNVIDGATVEPLPVASAADDWQVRYNTRWVPRDRFAPAR